MVGHMLLQMLGGVEHFVAVSVAGVELLVVIEVGDFAGDGAAVGAFLLVIDVAFVAEVVHAGLQKDADLDGELALGTDFRMLVVPCGVGLGWSHMYPQRAPLIEHHLPVEGRVVGVFLWLLSHSVSFKYYLLYTMGSNDPSWACCSATVVPIYVTYRWSD